MKATTVPAAGWLRVACAAFAAACTLPLAAQTIPNPSFEENSFGTFPGYISGNTAIAGWTGTPENHVGLNPSGGSPFADNGAIPHGNNVALIQVNTDDPSTPSTLSTTISGLTVGTTYKLTFRANARTDGTANTPNIKVYIDGMGVLLPGGPDGLSTAPVGAANPYWTVACEFQATATSQVLSIVNDADGDQTLLVDDFKIAPTNGRWAYAAWTSDADSGVDESFFYTHAYNFNSSAGTVINGVPFTGVSGGNPAVAGRFSTTYLGNQFGGDDNNLTFLGDGGSVLARDFVYGGNVPAGLYQSVKIEGLTPGVEYLATLYTVAWENPSVGSRWATFTAGDDALTINQDSFYDNNGILISYRYTADASGSATLKFAPLVPANLSIHIYGFSNREAVSRDVLPVINVQPRTAVVSPDLDVTFSVSASGVPTPTYQWRFNGANIPGATDTSYTVPAADASKAGTYDVVVSNRAGSVPSSPARLIVGIPMVNPSFEADVFDVFPGYVSGNFPITGWASEGGHGINPTSDGQSPFANSGAIPNGTHAAFMQALGSLHQTVTGLTPGAQYYVHYQESSRAGYAIPGLEVQVGGATVVPAHNVIAVTGANPYWSISSAVFTAAGTETELAFIKSSPQGGDATAVLDNVAVVPVASGTAPTISTQPAGLTVYVGQPVSFWVLAQGSLPITYQWKLNGTPIAGATSPTLAIDKVRLADEGDYTVTVSNGAGSVTSAVARLALLEAITSLHSTGLDANNQPIAGGAVDPFWTFLTNPDGGSPDTFVGTEVWPIGSAWSANSTASKWIAPRANVGDGGIAGGDYVVRTTFDLKDRDTTTVFIEGGWQSDNLGTSVYLNGQTISIPLSTSMTAFTGFSLSSKDVTFLPGINTLDFAWNNAGAGPAAIRVQFNRTSARTLPGIKPSIAANPVGGEAVEGTSFQFNVTANGTLPLSYQWRKNGADLPGKTEPILTLTGLTTADSGNYSVKVSNQWGDAFSADAHLCVCFRPIPGIFGTGVGTSGALLGDGEVDPHYTLTASADANYPGPEAVTITNAWPIAPAGPYVVNGPASRWIAPRSDQRSDLTPATSGNIDGNYTFHTSFDLTGYDLSKVHIQGQWAVDNGGVDIVLNDASTGLVNNNGFGSWTTFTLSEGLVAGPNTVDFIVYNAVDATWGVNPMGLRVDLNGYIDIQVTPQPTVTIALQGASVTVAWSPASAGQELQSAPTVTGPWTKIQGATNPYATAPTAGAQFFRVVAQ